MKFITSLLHISITCVLVNKKEKESLLESRESMWYRKYSVPTSVVSYLAKN